jgi:hypothetical protein
MPARQAQRVDLPGADDTAALLIGRVVAALAQGDEQEAGRQLAPIAGQTCLSHPITQLPTLPREGWPAGIGTTTRNPAVSVIASVYVRDHFTCLYCGRLTIPTQVMRLISARFPHEFAYHPNWKMSVAHRLYWDISTSLDHAVAVSRGGAWQDTGNLVTVCARCQYQKGNLTLGSLGWARREPRPGWDGLVRYYRPLWDWCGQPTGNYRAWLSAFGVVMAPSRETTP